jgi:protein-tyrosine phosphatase
VGQSLGSPISRQVKRHRRSCENEQPPRYNKQSEEFALWSIYSIPIQEGCAFSLNQVREFTAGLTAFPERTKVLVFCESGLGRTACMGAAYWITKGLTASEAISRISEACSAMDWVTLERQRVLDEYDRLMKA